MRLPFRHVVIAGVKVPVRINRALRDFGNCDREPVAITLGRPALENTEVLLATLIHEIRHAALILSGVSHGLTHKQQEQVVRCMENIADPVTALVTSKLRNPS